MLVNYNNCLSPNSILLISLLSSQHFSCIISLSFFLQKCNDTSWDLCGSLDFLELLPQASEETLHSSHEEEDPLKGMEPYLVRRLSCRNIQLPPLAFRQLEQADLKSESENLQRPTSLPLKILPLIAITSADSSG